MRIAVIATLISAGLVSASYSQTPCCGGYNLGASYTGQIATRSYVPDLNDTVNRQVMSRSIHFARQTLTNLQIEVPNFWVNGNTSEVGNGGSVGTFPSATVTASVEYPFNTCTQIKFTGSATGTITTGNGHLLSDSVAINIPNGAPFAIRLFYVGTSGVPLSDIYQPNIGDAGLLTVSGGVDRTVSCGAIADSAAGNIPPLAIVAATAKPAVCLIGDSIMAGQVPNFDATGDVGIVAPSVSQSFGYINMGRGSTTASGFAGSSTIRQALFKYCSAMIDEYGTNDLLSGSVATLESNLQTIYAFFTAQAQAPKLIERLTIIPRTTSSDNWTTSVNQTLPAWEANRVTFNNDVRTGSFYTGNYSDVNMAVGTGANFGLWKTPVTSINCAKASNNVYWTDDGTHPDACGALQVFLSGIVDMNHIHR